MLGRVEGKYDVDGTAAAGATTVYKPIEITRNTPPQRKKHFYGVSVRPGINCCDAVKAIARERYLQGEAPALPVTPGAPASGADELATSSFHSTSRSERSRRFRSRHRFMTIRYSQV